MGTYKITRTIKIIKDILISADNLGEAIEIAKELEESCYNNEEVIEQVHSPGGKIYEWEMKHGTFYTKDDIDEYP